MKTIIILLVSVWAPTVVRAGDEPVTAVLARRGDLILDDDGSIDRGGKQVALLQRGTRVRMSVGRWNRSDAERNVWRSTWKTGMGHVPVAAYQGIRARNLIVEVTFRYGPNTEPWHHQCFRIAADNRPDITGHVVSAWANVDNDFIESGFLLQHIRKTPEKKIIEDLLMDRQPLSIESGKWYTAVLEVVDDEALFRMDGHVAWARSQRIRAPKNLVSITLGTTWHEIRRVRIWHAQPNPEWMSLKSDILAARKPFKLKVHDYRKPK